MEFKGTKGDWRFDISGNVVATEEQKSIGVVICSFTGAYFETDEEQEANTQLIAAAPEMLEALRKITNDASIMSLGECGDTVLVMVDSVNEGVRAINKALNK